MRKLKITIYPRPNTNDLLFNFNSDNLDDSSRIYELISLQLDYSIITSAVMGTLILGLSEPISTDTVLVDNNLTDIILRSGQNVQITDNGSIVFEGILLQANYKINAKGIYLIATIAPSIFQLTQQPLIFDSNQASQISKLLNIDVTSILITNVTQDVDTQLFLNAIVTNTDYNSFFNKTIAATDLGDTLYLMTSLGAARDETLRNSIDYYNCVFYQQEDGQIIIRQLDAKIKSPFQLDITNFSIGPAQGANDVPTVAYLDLDYNDNACMTPSTVSNYSILPPNLGGGSNAVNNLLSYIPSPKYFPRVQQLANSGWFTGHIGKTQIGSNIVSNPTTRAALTQFESYPEQYMQTSGSSNVAEGFIGAYQQLLTAKQMGAALTNYANVTATISLDDINLPNPLPTVLGTTINIQNCPLSTALISTCTRTYTMESAFLTINCVPLGSYTGYWKS